MLRIVVLSTILLAGCVRDVEPPPAPPPEPMPTTGPNQVVIYVPTMVCESCPQKVAEGLAMLPWIDMESLQPDRKLKQMRFTVKDRAAFDAEAVKDTVTRKGFKGVLVLAGPS